MRRMAAATAKMKKVARPSARVNSDGCDLMTARVYQIAVQPPKKLIS